MAEGEKQAVLRRMTRRVQTGRPATPPPGAQAVVLALARAAQATMGLALRATDRAETRETLAELLERLPERALLALIEGPGGALGVVALSPAILAGLIEMQTLGRIGKGDVVPRRPTRTDAALAAGFVDRALAESDAALAAEGPAWPAGFRYGSFLDDPRPLGLLLEDGAYRTVRISLELGIGTVRRGPLTISLPLPEELQAGGEKKRRDRPAAATVPAAAGGLEPAAGDLRTELLASFPPRPIPIGDLLALSVGQEIALGEDALSSVEIRALDRRLVARGRLGQAHGHRAVRLTAIEGEAGPDTTENAVDAVGGLPVQMLRPGPAVGQPPAYARDGRAEDETPAPGHARTG